MSRGAAPERTWPLLSPFAALAAALGVYVLINGPATGSDTHGYVLWADRLTANGFNYSAVLREYGEPMGATYALFVGLVALLRLAFAEHWGSALIVLNVLCVAATGALLARLAVRVTGNRAAGWAALGLFLLCHDLWLWTPYLLSDSVFLLFAFSVFLMEASRLLAKGKAWPPVFAASAAASLFRPTGMVLFAVTSWSFVLAKLPDRAGARWLALLGLALAGAAGATLFGWIVEVPARWPFPFGARALRYISAAYSEGLVVWQRPETYLAPPHGLGGYLAIMAARFGWFFAPGAAGYSGAHWAMQIAFFAPAYALACWFMATLLTGRSTLERGSRDVGLAALGAIILYAMFHALMHVDYDWRYRVPVLPHLILLAACGFSDLQARWSARTAPPSLSFATA
ncbi:MAG TPA: hypothetical protein VIA98_01785 [Allosphingosinicella sp.]